MPVLGKGIKSFDWMKLLLLGEIMNFIAQVCSVTLVALFFLPPAVYSAIQITCTVTAKRANSVKVECKPHKTAGTRVGDRVAFKSRIKGLEVKAGQGEVTEVTPRSVGIKVMKGHLG